MAVLGRRHRHRQHRNPQGFRWLISVLAVLGLAFAGLVGGAGVAAASSDENHEEYWEGEGYGDCTKVESPGGTSYTLPEPPAGQVWTLLVIKAGSKNSNSSGEAREVYEDPQSGVAYAAPVNQQDEPRDISHVIYCSDEPEPQPQEPSVTATAQPCSESDEATGVVTVTVENPNAEGVTYTVELAGQDEELEVAGEASGSVTFEGVAAGTHTVTVDGNDDTSVEASVTVEECEPGQQEPQEPSVTATSQGCAAVGAANGVVTVTVENPNAEAVTYTVELAGQDEELEVAGEASRSVTFTGLAAGEHHYVVTGDDDTSVDGSVTVEECEPGQQQPQEPAVTVSDQACSESDEATGEVTVTVENPNAEAVTYTVELAGQEESVDVAGEATESVIFEGVAAGTYTVTVDGNDDTSVEASVTVEECEPGQEEPGEPEEPTVTASARDCSDADEASGKVRVRVKNPNAETVTYTVTLDGRDKSVDVAGGESEGVTFNHVEAGTHEITVRGDDDTSVEVSVMVEECPEPGEEEPEEDVCLNINGIQTTVPAGFATDDEDNCVASTAVLGTKIPAQSGTQVLGTKVAAGTLARTGGEVSGLLGLSLVFMGAGAALLTGRRRSAKG